MFFLFVCKFIFCFFLFTSISFHCFVIFSFVFLFFCKVIENCFTCTTFKISNPKPRYVNLPTHFQREFTSNSFDFLNGVELFLFFGDKNIYNSKFVFETMFKTFIIIYNFIIVCLYDFFWSQKLINWVKARLTTWHSSFPWLNIMTINRLNIFKLKYHFGKIWP